VETGHTKVTMKLFNTVVGFNMELQTLLVAEALATNLGKWKLIKEFKFYVLFLPGTKTF
jgi:hypothetical protein